MPSYALMLLDNFDRPWVLMTDETWCKPEDIDTFALTVWFFPTRYQANKVRQLWNRQDIHILGV